VDDEELQAVASEIRGAASMVHKIAMRDMVQRLDACNAGVSGLQYGVLRFLKHHGGTLSDMSSRLRLAPSTLVPVVDALVQKGLLERGSDPQDRRRTPLVLTARGVETLNMVPGVDSADSLVRGLAALGGEKTLMLRSLLRELLEVMTGLDDTGRLDLHGWHGAQG
jgi:DNA-binding MarR family transcriptional regulator